MSELAEAFERLHHQPRALIDLVLLFSSSEGDSLTAILDERVEAQLTGARYGTLWSSMKPLQQRICLRVARGEDVTSAEARREYALGSNKAEIPPGSINDALRAMVGSHVLTKSPGGRGRYKIDDPLFAEWLRRESEKLRDRPRQVSRVFEESAKAYASNPVALQLRGMNILLEGMRQNSTIVIVPSSAVETMGLGAMAGVTALAKQFADPHGAKSVSTQSRGGATLETPQA